MEYQYTYNGEVYTIDLVPLPNGSYTATIDGQSYHAQMQRQYDGELVLLIDGKPVNAVIAATRNNRYYVSLHRGKTYELEAYEPTSTRRKGSGGGAGNLNAQMPGQIIQILVEEGETVEAGQQLLIMEAMKMEIRVSSPVDGIVKRILVTTGDTVDRGQLLVEVETT